jgi:hypothetical protein
MAYADPIDAATPTDADFAGQGDDKTREFKRGVRQRLASFFVDPDADPLVPKANSIPVTVFADNTFPGQKLVPDSILSSKLADGAVIQLKLADNAVATAKIIDGAVTTPKLADNAVTNPKLDDDAVTTSKILDAAVTTPKIADGAVTLAKLVAGLIIPPLQFAAGVYVFPTPLTIEQVDLTNANDSWIDVDISNADIDALLGPNFLVVLVADLSDAIVGPQPGGSHHWSDLVTMNGCIVDVAGTNKLRIRVTNNQSFDLTTGSVNSPEGKTLFWFILSGPTNV